MNSLQDYKVILAIRIAYFFAHDLLFINNKTNWNMCKMMFNDPILPTISLIENHMASSLLTLFISQATIVLCVGFHV